MRQQKIHKWDSPLKLFEKQHLASEGIRSKAELEDSLNWQLEFTEECQECKKIREKLK